MFKRIIHRIKNPRSNADDIVDNYHVIILILAVLIYSVVLSVTASHFMPYTLFIIIAGIVWLILGLCAVLLDIIKSDFINLMLVLPIIVPFMTIMAIFTVVLEFTLPTKYTVKEFFEDDSFEDYV